MKYADYKQRYMILGAEALATASNDKDGVFKLMEKIAFPVEKFQCGHTMVFFRAGALAALEEARDSIVLKLVRYMQGEGYGRIRRAVYQVKADQRQLMEVIQRNFRKYMSLRTWGWFIIINKTKPLIGRVNLEDELRMLEEAAQTKWGAYEEQVNMKVRKYNLLALHLFTANYNARSPKFLMSCNYTIHDFIFRQDSFKRILLQKKKLKQWSLSLNHHKETYPNILIVKHLQLWKKLDWKEFFQVLVIN